MIAIKTDWTCDEPGCQAATQIDAVLCPSGRVGVMVDRTLNGWVVQESSGHDRIRLSAFCPAHSKREGVVSGPPT